MYLETAIKKVKVYVTDIKKCEIDKIELDFDISLGYLRSIDIKIDQGELEIDLDNYNDFKKFIEELENWI